MTEEVPKDTTTTNINISINTTANTNINSTTIIIAIKETKEITEIAENTEIIGTKEIRENKDINAMIVIEETMMIIITATEETDPLAEMTMEIEGKIEATLWKIEMKISLPQTKEAH